MQSISTQLNAASCLRTLYIMSVQFPSLGSVYTFAPFGSKIYLCYSFHSWESFPCLHNSVACTLIPFPLFFLLLLLSLLNGKFQTHTQVCSLMTPHVFITKVQQLSKYGQFCFICIFNNFPLYQVILKPVPKHQVIISIDISIRISKNRLI